MLMMVQYIEIKMVNLDSLLFYWMGDFYELFFEDVEVVLRVLGIILIKCGKYQGDDILMCGVLVYVVDDYFQKLIVLGYWVLVCEQIEDLVEVKKCGLKLVVCWDVVWFVIFGIFIEEWLLDVGVNNYFMVFICFKGGLFVGDVVYGFVWIDMLIGFFQVFEIDYQCFVVDFVQIVLKELILVDNLLQEFDLWQIVE